MSIETASELREMGEHMASSRLRNLARGYTSEVNGSDEVAWYEALADFDDANIFQTWAYGVVASGHRNVSHLLLRENGKVVAMAQARIARVPGFNVGIAYVRWGPLWRRRLTKESPDVLRQALRALRNEFACKRGLVVRILPLLFHDDPQSYATILEEEGFTLSKAQTPNRTILMQLDPSIETLREGMRPHWKRELKIAERKGLEVFEGFGDDLFGSLIDIHSEMVSRKQFVEGADINQFRLMQAKLPDQLKMKIMICRSSAGVCSGLVCSAIGDTAVYLFGATSNLGMKSNGSYLLHWKLIERLKQDGRAVYDLNGINPDANPGTYKFKGDLAGKHGRDVLFLGQFESHANGVSHLCVDVGGWLRACVRKMWRASRTLRGEKPSLKVGR